MLTDFVSKASIFILLTTIYPIIPCKKEENIV